MPEESAKKAHPPRAYVFRCKAERVPPGTKFSQKLPRGEEMFLEPSYLKWWLLGAGAVSFALGVGLLIGRFMLR